MRALVMGGAGFIGSHVVEALLARGYSVRVLDNLQRRVHPRGRPTYLPTSIDFCAGDVRDRSTLQNALEGMDVVFHQAAYQDLMLDYSTFFHTNVVSTALLFEIIREKNFPIQKVIVASSQAAYGEGHYQCTEHGFMQPAPRSLEQLDRGDWEVYCDQCGREMQPVPLSEKHTRPLSPYGVSKYCQEAVALRLGALLKIPTVGLRYSIVQGARQSFYNAYSGICRIFTRSIRNGQRPVIYEDGNQRRDYVHIADVVSANLLVLDDKRADYEVFNVGTGQPMTVLEYAKTLIDTMKATVEPSIAGLYRLGDARHTVSSIDKLSRLGWKPTKGLREIFTDYLRWLDTVEDSGDYFTPAFQDMKQQGVLRPVQRKQFQTN